MNANHFKEAPDGVSPSGACVCSAVCALRSPLLSPDQKPNRSANLAEILYVTSGKKRCQGRKGVRNRFRAFWGGLGGEACFPVPVGGRSGRTKLPRRTDCRVARNDAAPPTPPRFAVR